MVYSGKIASEIGLVFGNDVFRQLSPAMGPNQMLLESSAFIESVIT